MGLEKKLRYLLMVRERSKVVIQHKLHGDWLQGLPTIPHALAVSISIAFAIAYVAPFYFSSSLRISEHVSRNSAESIRARCRAVVLTCALCTAVTINVQAVVGMTVYSDMLHRAGVYPVILTDVVRTMTLVAILFAGPLYEAGVVKGGWRSWIRWRSWKQEICDDWIGWRNYVVGPASEEWIFRSMNISLLLAAWTPPTRIVWEAPLLFGVAHLHHLNEFIIMHKRPGQSYMSALRTPSIMVPGVLRTAFQLAFTSVFGMFVTFVHLRTGNVYSCILAHTFCNWMGFPRLWGRLGPDEQEDLDQLAENESSDEQELDELDGSGTRPAREPVPRITKASKPVLGVQWTITYYVLLVGGCYGFSKLLYPLTESNARLVFL